MIPYFRVIEFLSLNKLFEFIQCDHYPKWLCQKFYSVNALKIFRRHWYCFIQLYLFPSNLWYDAGKELNDPRVLTDVGDVPVQEIRDCGVDDDRLMNIISESVKLVMEEVSHLLRSSYIALTLPFSINAT